MAERLNAAVLKTVNRVFGSWVRIPPPPPFMLFDYMTRTHKVSKGRIILTIACLFVFGCFVFLADRYVSSEDLQYVNPTFVSNGSNDVAINLDAMSVSMETEDVAVVQYIVQQ